MSRWPDQLRGFSRMDFGLAKVKVAATEESLVPEALTLE